MLEFDLENGEYQFVGLECRSKGSKIFIIPVDMCKCLQYLIFELNHRRHRSHSHAVSNWFHWVTLTSIQHCQRDTSNWPMPIVVPLEIWNFKSENTFRSELSWNGETYRWSLCTGPSNFHWPMWPELAIWFRLHQTLCFGALNCRKLRNSNMRKLSFRLMSIGIQFYSPNSSHFNPTIWSFAQSFVPFKLANRFVAFASLILTKFTSFVSNEWIIHSSTPPKPNRLQIACACCSLKLSAQTKANSLFCRFTCNTVTGCVDSTLSVVVTLKQLNSSDKSGHCGWPSHTYDCDTQPPLWQRNSSGEQSQRRSSSAPPKQSILPSHTHDSGMHFFCHEQWNWLLLHVFSGQFDSSAWFAQFCMPSHCWIDGKHGPVAPHDISSNLHCQFLHKSVASSLPSLQCTTLSHTSDRARHDPSLHWKWPGQPSISQSASSDPSEHWAIESQRSLKLMQVDPSLIDVPFWHSNWPAVHRE